MTIRAGYTSRYFFRSVFRACSWANDLGMRRSSRSLLRSVYPVSGCPHDGSRHGLTHTSNVGRASQRVQPKTEHEIMNTAAILKHATKRIRRDGGDVTRVSGWTAPYDGRSSGGDETSKGESSEHADGGRADKEETCVMGGCRSGTRPGYRARPEYAAQMGSGTEEEGKRSRVLERWQRIAHRRRRRRRPT
jgi:hypothetical protein